MSNSIFNTGKSPLSGLLGGQTQNRLSFSLTTSSGQIGFGAGAAKVSIKAGVGQNQLAAFKSDPVVRAYNDRADQLEKLAESVRDADEAITRSLETGLSFVAAGAQERLSSVENAIDELEEAGDLTASEAANLRSQTELAKGDAQVAIDQEGAANSCPTNIASAASGLANTFDNLAGEARDQATLQQTNLLVADKAGPNRLPSFSAASNLTSFVATQVRGLSVNDLVNIHGFA